MAKLKTHYTQFFPVSLRDYIKANKEDFAKDPSKHISKIINKFESSINNDYSYDDIRQFFNIQTAQPDGETEHNPLSKEDNVTSPVIDDSVFMDAIIRKKYTCKIELLKVDNKNQVMHLRVTLDINVDNEEDDVDETN
jgi:hypothetical protein